MTDHHRAAKSIRQEPGSPLRRGDTGSLREGPPRAVHHDPRGRCGELLQALEGLHVALPVDEVARALVAVRQLRHALEEAPGGGPTAEASLLRSVLRLEEGLSALHDHDKQVELLPHAEGVRPGGRLALASAVLDALRGSFDELTRATTAPGGAAAGPPPGR